MKKREQFAVSLRKQKTNEIIIAKRRRFFDKNHDNPINDAEQYRGYRDFDNRPEEYENRLRDLAPELFNEGLNSTIVSGNFKQIVCYSQLKSKIFLFKTDLSSTKT